MSGSNTNDYKSQVLAATNIVELIGQSVALKQRGRKYVGLCPFHQEKTGSFNVDSVKQFFFCFGCKAAGNAIDFVMKRDRIEFIDALKFLGQKAGIEMPKFGVSKEKASERQILLDAHSAACSFFEKSLLDQQLGQIARDYLAERGIDAKSIQKFQIGLAIESWDALLKSSVMRKYAPPQLALAGLVKTRENGQGFYDTFRNRLMFPIRDENARIIAFGGRVMPGSQDPAKYLNSPETPLFSKSRCVFGLDQAKQKIVESRTVAVVEGYTDVVMAHQYGVTNVVSILGTAMTEQHLGILRRFADKVVLLFDPDTAGDVAVNRAVELFLTQPVEIAIATLPEDLDPDEYLIKYGAEAFEKVLSDATDALAYKWNQLDRQFKTNDGDLTGQAKAVEEYLKTLAQARGTGPVDSIRWGLALARVSRLTDIPVEDLDRRFKANRPAPRRPAGFASAQAQPDAQPTMTVPPARPTNARDYAERWLLAVLLVEPHRWHDVQSTVNVGDFEEGPRRRLAEIYWNHQRDEGEPVFNEFLGLLNESELVQLAIELVDEVSALPPDLDQTLADSVAHLAQVRRSRHEQKKLVAELRRTSDEKRPEIDEIALLRQLQEQARRPDVAGRI